MPEIEVWFGFRESEARTPEMIDDVGRERTRMWNDVQGKNVRASLD